MLKDGFQTLTIPVSAMYEIELAAPGNSHTKHPGVKVNGKFELKKGQKITVALGQQGSDPCGGSGGSFVVLNEDRGPQPLLVAAGAGHAFFSDKEFGSGNVERTGMGNGRIKASGKQMF